MTHRGFLPHRRHLYPDQHQHLDHRLPLIMSITMECSCSQRPLAFEHKSKVCKKSPVFLLKLGDGGQSVVQRTQAAFSERTWEIITIIAPSAERMGQMFNNCSGDVPEGALREGPETCLRFFAWPVPVPQHELQNLKDMASTVEHSWSRRHRAKGPWTRTVYKPAGISVRLRFF